MAAAVMSIDKQKARADEALELVGQLDTSMQKAVYIATKMFLAAKETPGTYSSRTPGLKTPNRTKEPGRPGNSTEEEKPG